MSGEYVRPVPIVSKEDPLLDTLLALGWPEGDMEIYETEQEKEAANPEQNRFDKILQAMAELDMDGIINEEGPLLGTDIVIISLYGLISGDLADELLHMERAKRIDYLKSLK